MRRTLAQLALGLVGLLALGWALVGGADPEITCRGEVMRPGESCAHAGDGRTQTYEERFSAAQVARPVVGTVGLLVVGFASYLWVTTRAREDGAPD